VTNKIKQTNNSNTNKNKQPEKKMDIQWPFRKVGLQGGWVEVSIIRSRRRDSCFYSFGPWWDQHPRILPKDPAPLLSSDRIALLAISFGEKDL
jgi:hypothetical protein